jgi:cytidylate kinase
MYRALALKCLRDGIPLDDEKRAAAAAGALSVSFVPEGDSQKVLLDGEDVTEKIRAQEISDASSKIAVIPAVRAALVSKQREIGEGGGVVAEGRDTTTAVFPGAELKVYMDAALRVRAERRRLELEESGEKLSPAEVEEDLRSRDERDSARAESPLCAAPDALLVDTSSLSVGEQVEAVLERARELTGGG